MTTKEIIDGLQFTVDMFLLDPTSGETRSREHLNDMDKTTVESCEGAIKILKAIDDKLAGLVDEMESIFSDIREKEVDDSVCGLCEYDCDHGLDGFANECPGFEKDDCFKLKEEYKREWLEFKEVSDGSD